MGYSPKNGYLAFEYVDDPFCDEESIPGDGSAVADHR